MNDNDNSTNPKEEFFKKAEKIMDTNDETNNFDKKEIEEGKGMAIISYILAFIPYFTEKKNKYVKFHARQGMDLLVIWITYSILYNILISVIKVNSSCGMWFGYNLGYYCRVTPWWITIPLNIIGLIIVIISLMGLINAIMGKAKELLIINRMKIFK